MIWKHAKQGLDEDPDRQFSFASHVDMVEDAAAESPIASSVPVHVIEKITREVWQKYGRR